MAANDYRLLENARADLEAGRITIAEFKELEGVYLSVYGGFFSDEEEAGQWGADKIDAIVDSQTYDAIVDPLAAVPGVKRTINNLGSGLEATSTLLKWLLPVAVVGVAAIYAAPVLAPHVKRALKAIK